MPLPIIPALVVAGISLLLKGCGNGPDEEEVHPRREFSNHDAFYAPLYRDIEAAYQTGDVEELKGAISALVDGIVHD